MNRYLLILLAILVVGLLSAQTYGEIGNGTTSTNLPSYLLWEYSWGAQIYPAAAFSGPKNITQIAFQRVNTNDQTLTNQKIYLKETTQSSFVGYGYDDPLTSNYTLVYDGSISMISGWIIIDITDFNYSGTGNLIVQWENRSGMGNYTTNWYSTDSTVGSVKCNGSAASFPASTGFAPYPVALPNFRFYYATNSPVNPSEPNPVSNATAVNINSSLSFTLGTNTTGYHIMVGTSEANMTEVATNTVPGPGTYSYTPATPWAAGTQYFWKVVATNAMGSTQGTVWHFTTEYFVTSLPYTQGFEGAQFPPVGWSNAENYWSQATHPHSGASCAKVSYVHLGNATLMTPTFQLPANPTRLKFWWADSDDLSERIIGHDTTYVEISNNSGQTWSILTFLSAQGLEHAYHQAEVNLTSYAGQNVKFRWRDRTDQASAAYGALLDDVLIEQIPTEAVIVINPTSLVFNEAAIGSTLSLAASITNQGSSPLIISTITPSGPFSADNPGTINAGQTVNMNVHFIPTNPGNATGSITFGGNFTGNSVIQLSGAAYTSLSSFYENFDASLELPTHWKTIINASSPVSYVGVRASSFDAHSGLNFLKMYNAGADTINTDLILISPGLVQLSNNGLHFYAKSSWGQTTDHLLLGTITDPYDASTFTSLQTINLTADYQQINYTFTPEMTNKYIAFKHGLGGSIGYAIYLEDISWEASGTVPNPAVTVFPTNQQSNVRVRYEDKHLISALNWSNGGGGTTGYKIYFGTSPAFNLINELDLGLVEVDTLQIALNYNTQYYWKIVPYNASGNAVNCSTWSFTTQPNPTVVLSATTTLNEGFESTEVGGYPQGWELQNLNNDSVFWSGIANSTSSVNAHTGTKAMHMGFSFLSSHNDWLYTPPLQMIGGHTYKLDFWYKSIPFPGDPCVEKMEVKWGTMPNSNSMLASLFDNASITTETYTHFENTLSAPVDGVYFVGFHAYSDPLQFILLLDDVKVTLTGTGIDDPIVIPIMADRLNGNYPNPFNPSTTISYQLKQDGKVNIEIYNIKGQKVRTLINSIQKRGKQTVQWNGTDDLGQNVGSGVYFCKMQTLNLSETCKMILMK